MDLQRGRSRSTSIGQQHAGHISQAQPPYQHQSDDITSGLGLNLDHSSASLQPTFDTSNNSFLQQSSPYGQQNIPDSTLYDPSVAFAQQMSMSGPESTMPFAPPSQTSYLSPDMTDGDFSLFPSSTGQADQYNQPLFDQPTMNPNDMNNMASPTSQHSPTSPHLLKPEPHHAGSVQHSPSFNQHQFSSPISSHHSRQTSLTPGSALYPNSGDWSRAQFHGHRRSPSAHSDVSSVAPSPNLINSDTFDHDLGGHSPLQQPMDGMYQDVLSIGDFSISDPVNAPSPGFQGHSPSHSPAISPRIMPQLPPDIPQPHFGLMTPGGSLFGDAPGYSNAQPANEAFPNLQSGNSPDISQMPAPPAINIDFAPTNKAALNPEMDEGSLTPHERGRTIRRRAGTDPFHPVGRHLGSISPSPSLGSDLSARSDVSRSLSPLDRDGGSRRRQSTSAVPNNVMALRLADPDYQAGSESGSSKRAQKHPATFQCKLCPKRFTRAYNLRSHLRTHTDERPFVCAVCSKAFARQHDRKRHESLHSGEKKFVCKGELKQGGQWGCGRRFARADALGRHFRSEAGRICIKPLLDEEMAERQRQWQQQQMQQNNNMAATTTQNMDLDPTTGYPVDSQGQYMLPAALLAQYPALAQIQWPSPGEDLASGGGRSSFDASDFEEGEDGGYVSGAGTAYSDGGLGQGFGELNYSSDMGGR